MAQRLALLVPLAAMAACTAARFERVVDETIVPLARSVAALLYMAAHFVAPFIQGISVNLSQPHGY